MRLNLISMKKLTVILGAFLILASAVYSAEKLPVTKVDSIGQPTGKIAFIRNGNIWSMEASGSDQQMICEATNADGRLSWSADGKQIVFTRSGFVDLKGPDMLGGRHKVYDLFLCYLDSAYANNRMYWYRLTDDLGNRGPEWSFDGQKIIYWKDMNANKANAFTPNYQICMMDPDGSDVQILRKDWQNFSEDYMISPSINKNGDIAFIYFLKQRLVGPVVLPKDKFMVPLDTIRAIAGKNVGYVAPAWSPDGKWLALISNNMDDAGLYIFSPDLKEKYLVATPPVGTYLNTFAVSFSPDSKWITFSTTDGSIWIVDITGNGLRRLTGPGTDKAPCWSK